MDLSAPPLGHILVTGGAGYIGSHMVQVLNAHGYEVVVYDNLATGFRDALPPCTFIKGDLADRARLATVFTRQRIAAVMHFAASIAVGESVRQPAAYYRNNVVHTLNLLDAMRAHAVDRLVFSSTAAVYGEPLETPITEAHPLRPLNPYGRSKLMVEQILADHAAAYGLTAVSLRYFNAAGADPAGARGERHEPETHLIPLTLAAASGERASIDIFGDDYATADGTCVRDYIHVMDLCDAHLKALTYPRPGFRAFNLGNGAGFSVREVIAAVQAVTGREVPTRVRPRRAGDPAVLIADATRARRELGWRPRYTRLARIVADAWRWHTRAPRGARVTEVIPNPADVSMAR